MDADSLRDMYDMDRQLRSLQIEVARIQADLRAATPILARYGMPKLAAATYQIHEYLGKRIDELSNESVRTWRVARPHLRALYDNERPSLSA